MVDYRLSAMPNQLGVQSGDIILADNGKRCPYAVFGSTDRIGNLFLVSVGPSHGGRQF